MPMPHSADVVIVGAGPTGLTAACSLLDRGVPDVLVLERNTAIEQTSRAAVLHARSLEVLSPLKVTPRLLDAGCVVPTFTVRDRRRLLARLDFSRLPTEFPYALMLPQSTTEQLLSDRLHDLGGQVRRGWNVTHVGEAAGGGALVEATSIDGESVSVQARYVVGADGGHSMVRETAGIDFAGGTYAASFVLADVHLEWPLSAAEGQLFLAPEGLMVVAPLPEGRHRVVATLSSAPEHPDRQLVQQLIEERGPGRAQVLDVVWASRFHVQHRLAGVLRRGSLLLAGDAAHVHSPAGGQGMNTGIQDAVDLAGCLADALLNGADSGLDGYAHRRRQVAARVVTLTDRATRAATLRGPVQRAARNAVIMTAGRFPPVRRRLAMQLSELALDR